MIVSRLIIAAMLAVPLACLAQPVDVPYLTGRVVDDAEILKPESRKQIAEALRDHEQRTTNQVAVLTVPTLLGESVEESVFRQDVHLQQTGADPATDAALALDGADELFAGDEPMLDQELAELLGVWVVGEA